VTTGLREIYQKDYSFELREYRDEETKTLKGLKPCLIREGREYNDLREEGGDGPRALVSFILQLSTVLMHPDCAKIIVADEPLGPIDQKAWVRFGEWLTDICTITGLQVVLVTHRESQFGDTYHVEQERGIARATKIT
jgi:ABC-type cobalamin/Fe3+-siderophores transport system ATPase subunit